MPVEVKTSLMIGGLDLASPPISMPPGKAIAAINYEPDVAGYTSFGGYERFDGQPRPSDASDAANIAARRSSIRKPPGTGPVRGVWVFDGAVYAFRDQLDGTGGMFRSSPGGWVLLTFGSILQFTAGSQEFLTDEYVTGKTSTATASIDRVILRAGAWDGTAEGYLIVSKIVGEFVTEDLETSSSAGVAIAHGLPLEPLGLKTGGHYDFTNHNFYGSSSRTRMYFVNGVDVAYEWSGSVLAPIHTGITGAALSVDYLLAPNGDFILAANGDSVIVSAAFDSPSFVSHYKNHLFLGFSSGSLINSSLGEPLEYVTTTGAGEIAFGEQITGLLTAASTSLVVFAQDRMDYLTGTDATTFQLNPLSDVSGAKPYTIQMMDQPVFLDDGGVRALSATAAFGDWRMGSLTQTVERLIRQKRNANITAKASMQIKGKDQYRLFWSDSTGITIYIGRKTPEVIPFKLPVNVFCACSGEIDTGVGDRLFIGCEDGYVYEMNRGTSYDGAEIQSYIRLPFTFAGSPMQHTRWMKASFEMDTPDDILIGVAFDIDYARGLGGSATSIDVDAGSAIISTDYYQNIDWTQPVEGVLEYHLSGIGPNIAATLIHNSAVARQHTISSQTYNFSRRRLKR